MHTYRHFIPENTAPIGARRIIVQDSNNRQVCAIPLGPLTPPAGEPLYRFGVVSDIHLWKTVTASYGYSNEKFDNILTHFENAGCSLCIVSGDLTITGFYTRTNEGDASTQSLDVGQFAQYKAICDSHAIPVHALCGNHESYYGMPVANNLDLLETYTGRGVLSYAVEQGNDLFILCGQPSPNAVMSDADFRWLGETLEANKGRRCFVFVHSHIDDNVEGGVEDSGNPAFARENSIFAYWGAAKTAAFIALLQKYPNVILFHGHTHMMFEGQQFDPAANYSRENGFRSVHVPSSSIPRKLVSADGSFESLHAESQGYIVDAYDDCVVLNGWDFVGGEPVAIGTYKIDVQGVTA